MGVNIQKVYHSRKGIGAIGSIYLEGVLEDAQYEWNNGYSFFKITSSTITLYEAPELYQKEGARGVLRFTFGDYTGSLDVYKTDEVPDNSGQYITGYHMYVSYESLLDIHNSLELYKERGLVNQFKQTRAITYYKNDEGNLLSCRDLEYRLGLLRGEGSDPYVTGIDYVVTGDITSVYTDIGRPAVYEPASFVSNVLGDKLYLTNRIGARPGSNYVRVDNAVLYNVDGFHVLELNRPHFRSVEKFITSHGIVDDTRLYGTGEVQNNVPWFKRWFRG